MESKAHTHSSATKKTSSLDPLKPKIVYPHRLALVYGVIPKLVLGYRIDDPLSGKYRRRVMPIRTLITSGVEQVEAELREKHDPYLNSIKSAQLQPLLIKLRDHIDLNKLSDEDLQKVKSDMNSTFSQNVVSPDDPEYMYDKKIEFAPTEESDNSWDEGNDDYEPVEEDFF